MLMRVWFRRVYVGLDGDPLNRARATDSSVEEGLGRYGLVDIDS